MNTLTLVQERDDAASGFSLRSAVESALESDIQSLEDGLRRTQERIRTFETQYGFSTVELLERYRHNQVQETLETIEWVGEYRMERHLRDRLQNLRGIRVAN
jgi:hypothetical protein